MNDEKALPEYYEINKVHPTRSGDHATYAEAMRLVGARQSKYALVDLVNWLLHREKQALAEVERLRARQSERTRLLGSMPILSPGRTHQREQWRADVGRMSDEDKEWLLDHMLELEQWVDRIGSILGTLAWKP